MNNPILRKLTSRKLWVALIGVAVGLAKTKDRKIVANKKELSMTPHIKRKHIFNSICGTQNRLELIAECALDETDKEILRLRYVEFCDFGFIADNLGLAYPTVIKRHKKALFALQGLAQERANMV